MPAWVEREMIAGTLLDVAGAARWLGVASGLRRVAPAVAVHAIEEEPPVSAGRLPVVWVDAPDAMNDACHELRRHTQLGLDVETTLQTRALCLVQVACPSAVYLFDALALAGLAPLAAIFTDPSIAKIIHNTP